MKTDKKKYYDGCDSVIIKRLNIIPGQLYHNQSKISNSYIMTAFVHLTGRQLSTILC